MAQTKRKRRRKHRGTQAGTIERPGRTGRPQGQTRAASPRETARQRREDRLNRPPTWRGALNRAVIAAALFGVISILALDQPVAAGVSLAALMVLLYLPMSYYTDRFLYNRRQRQRTGK